MKYPLKAKERKLLEPITTKYLVCPAPNIVIDAGTLEGERIVKKSKANAKVKMQNERRE